MASLRPHVYKHHYELTEADVTSIMNNIKANFPEFGDRDVKAIGSILRARTTAQDKKEAKRKE